MDGRRKKELASLLGDVEATRSSLAAFTAANKAGFGKASARRSDLTFGMIATALALVAAAAGIWFWHRSRQERRQRHMQHPVAEGQTLASRFATKEPPPPQQSESQVLQIVAKALVELLKPAVTQILTRKATGSLTSLLASAILKPVFDKRSNHWKAMRKQ